MTTVTKYMRGVFLSEAELPEAVAQITGRLSLFGIGTFDSIEEMDAQAVRKDNMEGEEYDVIITCEMKKRDAKEHTNV